MKKKVKTILPKKFDQSVSQNKSKLVKSEDFQLGKTKLENKEKTLPKIFKIHPYPIF